MLLLLLSLHQHHVMLVGCLSNLVLSHNPIVIILAILLVVPIKLAIILIFILLTATKLLVQIKTKLLKSKTTDMLIHETLSFSIDIAT